VSHFYQGDDDKEAIGQKRKIVGEKHQKNIAILHEDKNNVYFCMWFNRNHLYQPTSTLAYYRV
jgi:hypothetical protein